MKLQFEAEALSGVFANHHGFVPCDQRQGRYGWGLGLPLKANAVKQ